MTFKVGHKNRPKLHDSVNYSEKTQPSGLDMPEDLFVRYSMCRMKSQKDFNSSLHLTHRYIAVGVNVNHERVKIDGQALKSCLESEVLKLTNAA